MYNQRIPSFTLCCFLIIIILFSGCTSLNPIAATNEKNQNLGQNAVLTSNGNTIEVNLIKSNIISSGIPGNPPAYEFIFEIRNLGEKGIMIYHPYDPNAAGADYDVKLVDYGCFGYDVMVYGVYEKLADGSYKNNMMHVGGAMLKYIQMKKY
ncbi:MAG: hypothetical protein M0Q91_16745 [Methanoregula sp.]|jgi:hypothetical protein|nr:hypothetical protein [Methanoregula sp.]